MSENTMGISIIVPFLNESEGIELYCKTLDSYAMGLSFPIELVFVNDGSTDDSEEKLRGFSFQYIARSRLLTLSKNFGSHAALRAGLQRATFPFCMWMGADLQEPLEIIETAWEKLSKDEIDILYIEKRSVEVSAANRLFSRIYHHMMKTYAIKDYSSNGIATAAFNEKVKRFMNENVEANSSILLQIMDAGFRHEMISMDYAARSAGASKWTLSKKIKLFIDSFVAFSFMPIRLVSIMGVVIFVIGLVIGIATIVNRFLNPGVPLGYSTLVSIIALGFGITNISLGIIAEYLWRTFDAARARPVFLISDEKILKEE